MGKKRPSYFFCVGFDAYKNPPKILHYNLGNEASPETFLNFRLLQLADSSLKNKSYNTYLFFSFIITHLKWETAAVLGLLAVIVAQTAAAPIAA